MIYKTLFRAFGAARMLSERAQEWSARSARTRFFSFLPLGPVRGRILIAHRIDGLMLEPGTPRLREHNQFQEVVGLIEELVARGYAVDAVSHRRRRPTPRSDYDLFLSLRAPFDALSAGLDQDCIRVLYIDTTHWLYNNHASLGRSLEVQVARGIRPERDIEIERNCGIETADYAVMPGNDFVHDTFAFARKPVFEIVNPAIMLRPWPEEKDHGACARRFLWLGSRGLAHKGLGRTLEAFGGMSDHHLTVCGPLDQEPRFCEAYRRELQQCPNVRPYGWIDVTGPDFLALADATLALILPSCAEAQAGAVINGMAAGLVPIVSRQVGMDVTPDFGVLLDDDSPQSIRRAVRELAARAPDELRAMSRRAWEIARTRHSMQAYQQVVGDVVERILTQHPNLDASGFVRLAQPEEAPLRPARQAGLH